MGTSWRHWDNEKVELFAQATTLEQKFFNLSASQEEIFRGFIWKREKALPTSKKKKKDLKPDDQWWLCTSFQNCLAAPWNKPSCGYTLPTNISSYNRPKEKTILILFRFWFGVFFKPRSSWCILMTWLLASMEGESWRTAFCQEEWSLLKLSWVFSPTVWRHLCGQGCVVKQLCKPWFLSENTNHRLHVCCCSQGCTISWFHRDPCDANPRWVLPACIAG